MSKKSKQDKAAPPVRTKSIERVLRYEFNDTELLKIGRSLAEATRTLEAIQADKSRVMKDFGARIATQESQLLLLSGCIESGYEMRNVKCTVTLDFDSGNKSIVRDDTGELVGVEPMTPDEMQLELPMKDDDADPPRVHQGVVE